MPYELCARAQMFELSGIWFWSEMRRALAWDLSNQVDKLLLDVGMQIMLAIHLDKVVFVCEIVLGCEGSQRCKCW